MINKDRKPAVYIETSIISYLAARINNDLRVAAQQFSTIDGFHIAVAAVHGMEYLLTWNCTHIANAVMRPRIEAVCRYHGYEPPVICTPQELMEA